jgi:hypothetical protein
MLYCDDERLSGLLDFLRVGRGDAIVIPHPALLLDDFVVQLFAFSTLKILTQTLAYFNSV